MSDGAQIIRGPWPARPQAADGDEQERAPDRLESELGPGRMHLGFVVRECAVALGHPPTPRELADWANHQEDGRGEFCLFGREITVGEAKLILDHPGRAVTVRPERARPRSADGRAV